MNRPTRKTDKRRSSIAKAVSAFFFAENRLSVGWRLVVILLGAGIIALAGDLLGVASRLAFLLFG